jgi:hypothetical protein
MGSYYILDTTVSAFQPGMVHMPTIPALWEVEMGRSLSEVEPRQKNGRPYLKNN